MFSHASVYCTQVIHKNNLGTLRSDKQQHFYIKKVSFFFSFTDIREKWMKRRT